MGFAILMTGSFVGFLSAIFSGLALGLTWIECLGVYAIIGLSVTASIFIVRGVFCAAARQLA